MTAVLAIAALAIAGVAVALGIRVGSLKSEVTRERAAKKKAAAKLETTAAELATTRRRYEGVVSDLESEIAAMEADLRRCMVPSVLRDRLDRLRGVVQGAKS